MIMNEKGEASSGASVTDSCKMTTIIMISNDNSIIFNSGGVQKSCENVVAAVNDADKTLLSDSASDNSSLRRRHSAPATPDNSITPDSSFVTPKPMDGGKKSSGRHYKNSVSTHESDSEELNNSSSSATSTISSSRLDSLPNFLNSLEDCRDLVTSTPKKKTKPPLNGPHGLKFFVNPISGKMDIRPEAKAYEQHKMTAINTVGLPSVSNYCTLNHRRRKKSPSSSEGNDLNSTQSLNRTSASFSIYGDINDFRDLLKAASAKEQQRRRDSILWEFQESEEECTDAREEDGIDSCHEDEDEEDIHDANSLVKAILPTGCHRHPNNASLPPLVRDDQNSLIDENDDFFLTSLLDEKEPKARGQSLEASSSMANLWKTRQGFDSFLSLDYRVNRVKPAKLTSSSLEGLLEKDEEPEKRSEKGRFSRLSSLNLAAGSKILRRHTTYVKTNNLQQVRPKVHVHSWHATEKRSSKSKGQSKRIEDGQTPSRGSSIRKHLVKRSLSSSKIDQLGKRHLSDPDQVSANDVTITDETEGQNNDIGRVGAWATDFAKLLQDPVGLQTFAEFLKKEFSAENINFWVSCEKYRRLASTKSETDRHELAMTIVDQHLASGCSDPVNVDSHARQAAMDGMATLKDDLFALAQKQIYNLMKFDSYSRFLKSDLYKEALMAEMAGTTLPYANALDEDLMVDENAAKAVAESKTNSLNRTKKTDTDTGGNRRKSLLPWNRSKSKERSSSAAASDKHSSKASKAKSSKDELKAPSSLDVSKSSNNSSNFDDSGGLNDNCTLARVILPDKATTVVQTREGETIRAMVSRLLEKRGLRYTSFDVFATDGDKPLDLGADSQSLGCTEVRVEPRVLFRLELPSKKSIGVKAKPLKLVKDVLGPILHQYGWNLESVEVRRDGSDPTGVDLGATVASIDNSRLIVSSEDTTGFGMRSKRPHSCSLEDDRRSSSSLEASRDRNRRTLSATDDEKLAMPPPMSLPPKKSQGSKPVKVDKSGVTEELYEGLKIAQRGRLENQRGTEINFEMPDFLKRSHHDKENQPSFHHRRSEPSLQLSQRRSDVMPPNQMPDLQRMSSLGHFGTPNHYYSQIGGVENEYHQPYSLMNFRRDSFILAHGPNESTFSHDGRIANSSEAERFFNGGLDASGVSNFSNDSRLSFGFARGHHRVPLTPGPQTDSMYETLSHYKTGSHSVWTPDGRASGMMGRREPPPLPPKPRFSSSSSRPSYGSEVDLPLHRSHHPSLNYVGTSSEVNMPLRGSDVGHHGPRRDERGYSVSFV